ncbi:dienelactone hydrolase family protein [Legionella maioricensis]|uniref:Dienelactone hydrolase family protein n=1 Tax=Legionella maioricensis TaxID=2896528 RepID=A0A9X2ID61_9GAMM|nr:dienelactone hydrolase family protein [Legionella maioricensis]MCL9688424.1 dienelactone hydrolase family protein [Legionella maioricensis]
MIITEQINYSDGETVCQGFMAYNSSAKKLPGVMVAHDWGGRGEAVCNKAVQLASMGYVGFAIDMYGLAQLGQDKTERRALMTPLMRDRQKLAARITAAFNHLTQLPQIDKDKIAAIGYCFGGLCVLDLARTGADVKGVVSFHGLLAAPEGAINTHINTKILVLHGYDDPLVPPDQIEQFAAEMNERKVDWQVHMYGLVQHSFTNPQANDDEMGLHYDERADLRSWESTASFLREILL